MNKVLNFFELLMKIPRPSGKEGKIADFLCRFALRFGFSFHRDNLNNVIIKKDNGSDKTIILQSHIDMVCVAEKNIERNFEEQGIEAIYEGDFIRAKGTSLGADNGIGVGIILSLLLENNRNFPNIEAVFTVQEETTMNGAMGLDYSLLTGKTLLSFDGNEEGFIDVSSAGVVTTRLKKQLKMIEKKENSSIYSIDVSNLLGGHSGEDINKNRISAIEILGGILSEIEPTGLISLYGGEKGNAIPYSASVCVESNLSPNEIGLICAKYRMLEEENNNHPTVIYSKLDDANFEIFEARTVTGFLSKFRQGVLFSDEQNFPITSENLGILRFSNGFVDQTITIRSSEKQQEKFAISKLQELAENCGFNFDIENSNPYFSFNPNSVLRPLLIESYEKLFKKKAVARRIHAGLEGGVFAEHIEDIDICVIGVDIFDLHSTKERVRISSIFRTYDWIVETLIEFNKISNKEGISFEQ